MRGRRFKRTYRRHSYGRRRGSRRFGRRYSARKLALGEKKVYQLADVGVPLDWEGEDAATPTYGSLVQVNNPGFMTSGGDRETGMGTLYFSGCKIRYTIQMPAVPFSTTSANTIPFAVDSPVHYVRVLFIMDRQLRLPGAGAPVLTDFLDCAGNELDPLMAVTQFDEQVFLKRGKIIYDRCHKITQMRTAYLTGNTTTTAYETWGSMVVHRKKWIRLPRRRVRADVAGSENEGKGAVYMFAISSADPAYASDRKPVISYNIRSYFRDGTGLP